MYSAKIFRQIIFILIIAAIIGLAVNFPLVHKFFKGEFKQASSLLLSLLLVAFLILIIATIIRGIDIDCGCFGSLSRKVDYKLIITDFFLLFISLAVFFYPQRDISRK